MTTLTTRPIPLLPLVLPISMYCNDRPSSSGSGSSPSSLAGGLVQSESSFFQRHHEVTSPRISSTGSSYSRNCGNSPSSMDPGLDIGQERRRARGFLHGEYSQDREHADKINDRMSCCSEDSELSVGQEECCDNGSSLADAVPPATRAARRNKDPADESESADNASSFSEDHRVVGGSEVMGNDEASCDSSLNKEAMEPAILTSPLGMGLQPGPVIRPSPTRLQEEFLRKSHLYAEQLMKQQMQFMAVARASAFQLHHGGISPEMCKVGFRPPEIANNFSNFGGIQSHLNAISKISSQLNCDESALSKLTAFGLSSARELSQSPPSAANQFHSNHPLLPHQFLNNNLNETNLKFSIDNILKADFGRRITEPILKRGTTGHSAGSGKSASGNRRTSSHKANSEKHGGAAIDLTNSLLVGTSVNNNNSAISPSSVVGLRTPCDSVPTAKIANPLSPTPNSNVVTAATAAQPVSPCPGSGTTPQPAANGSSGESNSSSSSSSNSGSGGPMVWPAWVYCTRYSDRPSSGPRTRKPKKSPGEKAASSDEKRPRTAFSGPQLARLKHEFNENRYLTERRRQQLSAELGLNEAQIKIWFQNKRAKIKKASGTKNPLALQLMAQGLYNHSTVPLTHEEEELQELHAKGVA